MLRFLSRRRLLAIRNGRTGLADRSGPEMSRVCACRGYRWAMSRLDRITSDPAICHGQPTVRGLRYPVETLLELLSSGMTIDQVLDDYPDLA